MDPDTHPLAPLNPPFVDCPVVSGDTLTWLTAAQMMESDRLAIAGFGYCR